MQAVIVRDSVLKQNTIPAKKLLPQHKVEIEAGTYKIEKHAPACNGHRKITFAGPIAAEDGTEYRTWCIDDDDVDAPGEELERPAKKILEVPYYYQGDNYEMGQGSPWRHCNSNCAAMVLEHQIPGSLSGPAPKQGLQPEEYYMRRLDGDTTDHGVHTRALRKFGLETVFRYDLDYEDVIESIVKGFPVMLGTLTTPYGHIILAIGFDDDGLWVHDPVGEYPYRGGYGPHGECKHYPWRVMDRVWLVEGDRSGWGRLKID